jgi:hypothetical protein
LNLTEGMVRVLERRGTLHADRGPDGVYEVNAADVQAEAERRGLAAHGPIGEVEVEEVADAPLARPVARRPSPVPSESEYEPRSRAERDRERAARDAQHAAHDTARLAHQAAVEKRIADMTATFAPARPAAAPVEREDVIEVDDETAAFIAEMNGDDE